MSGCKQTARVQANPWLRPIPVNQGVILVLRQLGVASFDSRTKIAAETKHHLSHAAQATRNTALLPYFVLFTSHPTFIKFLLKHVKHSFGGISLQPSRHPSFLTVCSHSAAVALWEKKCFAYIFAELPTPQQTFSSFDRGWTAEPRGDKNPKGQRSVRALSQPRDC